MDSGNNATVKDNKDAKIKPVETTTAEKLIIVVLFILLFILIILVFIIRSSSSDAKKANKNINKTADKIKYISFDEDNSNTIIDSNVVGNGIMEITNSDLTDVLLQANQNSEDSLTNLQNENDYADTNNIDLSNKPDPPQTITTGKLTVNGTSVVNTLEITNITGASFGNITCNTLTVDKLNYSSIIKATNNDDAVWVYVENASDKGQKTYSISPAVFDSNVQIPTPIRVLFNTVGLEPSYTDGLWDITSSSLDINKKGGNSIRISGTESINLIPGEAEIAAANTIKSNGDPEYSDWVDAGYYKILAY